MSTRPTPPTEDPAADPAARFSQRPSIHDLLDVEIVQATAERVILRLPVDWRVHQPYGLLHGGVSALLAESAASFGASLAAGPGRNVVGIELNASHLRSLSEGHLTADATPIRVGRTVQVWHIALTDDDGRAICDARCSIAVLGEPGGAVGPVRSASEAGAPSGPEAPDRP